MRCNLLGVLTLLALGTCGSANAQTPRIVSTDPAAGAVSVALETTTTFEFDREIDLQAMKSVIIWRGASVQDMRVENGNRLVVAVTHEPESDVGWAYEGFYPTAPCERAPVETFFLRYTTANEIGPETIRGTIRLEELAGKTSRGARSTIDANARLIATDPAWNRWQDRTHDLVEARDRIQFPGTASPDYQIQKRFPATEYTRGTVAAMRVDEYVDFDGAVRTRETYVASGAVDGTGAFEIPFLYPGQYILRADSYTWSPEEGGVHYTGSYDANGDGVADRYELAEGGSPAVEVMLKDIRSFNYHVDEGLAPSLEAAAAFVRDQGLEPGPLELVGIEAYSVEPDGRARWNYTYHDPDNRQYIISGIIGFWDGRAFSAYQDTYRGDSPVISADRAAITRIVADALADSAVQAFRTKYDEPQLELMSAGSRTVYYGPGEIDGRPTWYLRFIGVSPVDDPADCAAERFYDSSLALYVDAVTAEVRARVYFPGLGETTAKPYESIARANVRAIVPDEETVELLSAVLHESGPRTVLDDRGSSWSFLYRTTTLGCLLVHTYGSIHLGQTCPSEDYKYIPESFVDSDVIIEHARAQGAEELFQDFAVVWQELRAGTSYRIGSHGYVGRPVWELNLSASDDWSWGTPAMEFHLVVDAVSGELIHVDSRRYIVATEDLLETPETAVLAQNYPNPFNPTTTIPFTLSAAGDVSLSVYDVTGRLVTTLVDGWLQAGRQAVTWTAAGVPSGVYFCHLQAGGHVQNVRMVLLR